MDLTEVKCPKCSVDILQAGFIVASVSYQAFVRDKGKLVKSHSKKSGLQTANCMMCGEAICVDVDELKRAA